MLFEGIIYVNSFLRPGVSSVFLKDTNFSFLHNYVTAKTSCRWAPNELRYFSFAPSFLSQLLDDQNPRWTHKLPPRPNLWDRLFFPFGWCAAPRELLTLGFPRQAFPPNNCIVSGFLMFVPFSSYVGCRLWLAGVLTPKEFIQASEEPMRGVFLCFSSSKSQPSHRAPVDPPFPSSPPP